METPGGRRRERDGSDAVDVEVDVGLVNDESVSVVAAVRALGTRASDVDCRKLEIVGLHDVESAAEWPLP